SRCPVLPARANGSVALSAHSAPRKTGQPSCCVFDRSAGPTPEPEFREPSCRAKESWQQDVPGNVWYFSRSRATAHPFPDLTAEGVVERRDRVSGEVSHVAVFDCEH